MRAIVRQAYGGPEQLLLREVPRPEPAAGQVRVRVRAFGLNRAEQYFRTGAWGDVAEISGIECVGEVDEDPSGRLGRGQRVLALMGGLGRTLPGSYAEFTCVPARHVVPVRTTLPWEVLAVLPESYATAWSCLHAVLAIDEGQRLLVRGANSALGRAALDLARLQGVRATATVRDLSRAHLARELGAEDVLVEDGDIAATLPSSFDAVLDLVGASTLQDSMRVLRRGGRACLAGFLGGGEPLAELDPVLQLPSGRLLGVFASAFAYGTPDWPLDDVPFQRLVDHAEAGRLRLAPSRVFSLEEIVDAHRILDAQAGQGKVVVVVDGRPSGAGQSSSPQVIVGSGRKDEQTISPTLSPP